MLHHVAAVLAHLQPKHHVSNNVGYQSQPSVKQDLKPAPLGMKGCRVSETLLVLRCGCLAALRRSAIQLEWHVPMRAFSAQSRFPNNENMSTAHVRYKPDTELPSCALKNNRGAQQNYGIVASMPSSAPRLEHVEAVAADQFYVSACKRVVPRSGMRH